jgi:hypothetical protein
VGLDSLHRRARRTAGGSSSDATEPLAALDAEAEEEE